MMNGILPPRQQFLVRGVLVAALLCVALNGCKSKQDAAMEQAKQQAASSGQAQQVVYTDKDGNTVTSTVEPPVAGQTGQVVTTVVTPKGAAPDAAAQTADTSNAQQATAPPPAAQPVGTATPPAAAPNPVPLPASTPPPAAVTTPVVRPAPPPDVHITAGTQLAVRIDQRISAKGSRPGDTFTGELVQPITSASGKELIPKGAPVAGTVDTAQKRGNFKGAASLALSLTSITIHGRSYPLDTHDVHRTEAGKGKRTGAFIGGGAGFGALIGGLAGGGKGALIGGLAGAGAGTAGAGLTGNGDLVIPAETVVRFNLADELVFRP